VVASYSNGMVTVLELLGVENGDMRKKLTIPKTPKSREPLDPKKPMAKMKVFNP